MFLRHFNTSFSNRIKLQGNKGSCFLFPILFYLFFYSYIFFQLSRRRITIDWLQKNWAQTNVIHLCNFLSKLQKLSHCKFKYKKARFKQWGNWILILILTPPFCASDQHISRETIREYIFYRNNDVVIARLLHMHFQDEASHSHLQNEHIGTSGLSILVIISPEN